MLESKFFRARGSIIGLEKVSERNLFTYLSDP